jgi:hypothetical protein
MKDHVAPIVVDDKLAVPADSWIFHFDFLPVLDRSASPLSLASPRVQVRANTAAAVRCFPDA